MDTQPRAYRRVRGSFHAKEQPENVMVNRLPSKTKDMLMRLLFLPVLTAAILIGGETVVLPQVVVAPPVVMVPQVVAPQVVLPQVVFPQVVVPFPFFGGFYEGRRDVYAYGHRGHESRGSAHHDDHGARGQRH